MNDLTEINIETIKQLRLEGKKYEANSLLKAYHQSRKNNTAQLNKELMRQERKIKKVVGICTVNYCTNPATHGVHCERCYNVYKLHLNRTRYGYSRLDRRLHYNNIPMSPGIIVVFVVHVDHQGNISYSI